MAASLGPHRAGRDPLTPHSPSRSLRLADLGAPEMDTAVEQPLPHRSAPFIDSLCAEEVSESS